MLVLALMTDCGLSLPCRTLAWSSLPGALHLLRFAGTLAMDSEAKNWNALLIDTSALLAVAHLSLLQSQPEGLTLTQVRTNVPVKLAAFVSMFRPLRWQPCTYVKLSSGATAATDKGLDGSFLRCAQ